MTDTTAPSFLTAWPTGETRPLASNLNYTPGETIPNLVVAKVCGEGAGSRELLDLADDEAKDEHGLTARADADDLTRLFQGFSKGFDDVKESGAPRSPYAHPASRATSRNRPPPRLRQRKAAFMSLAT